MKSQTVYVIKFALTRGIFTRNVEITNGKGAWCEQFEEYFYNSNRHKEYCYTAKEAIFMAEEMRQKKIIFLKKQLAKLKKMTFDLTSINNIKTEKCL